MSKSPRAATGVAQPGRGSGRKPPLRKAEYEILAEFRYTLRHFLDFSGGAATALGLTPQQHQALLAIKGYPGKAAVTPGELAERLAIRHNTAVELANRLAAQDLIERRPAPADRRQVLLALTPTAEAKLAALSASHRDELRRLRPVLKALLDRLS
ncbi:MAG TPA: MarR family transcriptional regulator [Ferrovibrio sp.]|jgi:DNA-binding MarR family transcriptional regulator|uniref:MarR family winged helix-turn-helix transcriptional regulator n=1 Tax=Ferrovibrio sp. TaxID=1917215 RepID=UPI002ED65374